MNLLRRIGHDTQYVLIGFPLSLISLPLLVAGFGVGVGTAVLWVGLPIFVGTLWLARAFASIERYRAGLGYPAYKRPNPAHSPVRRMLTPVADIQSWLDLLHGVFRLIPATLAFVVTVTWWAGALGGLSWWLWGWSLPNGPDDHDLPDLLGLGGSYSTHSFFYLAVGIFFLGTLPFVVRFVAAVEAGFARMLLNGITLVREEIAAQQRAAAVAAETAALSYLISPSSSLSAAGDR